MYKIQKQKKKKKKDVLITTFKGKTYTFEGLKKYGTKKEKEQFEEGHAIVFDAIIDNKGNYVSERYPKINFGKYIGRL